MRRISLAVLLLLFAVACSRGEEPETAKRSPDPSPEPPPVCPLTGEEAPAETDLEKPPLAVKIENSADSRPQAGLEDADIVYEELAEGGITRFLAIYHCSEAASLGPIRSARMVDPDILMEYAPVLFGYSGGNPAVKDKVESTDGVVDLRYGSHGDAYERKPGRRAPHNVFSTSATLRGIEDSQGVKGSPEIGFVFDPEAADDPCPSPSPAASPRRSPPANGDAGAPCPGAEESPPPGNAVSFSFAGSRLTRFTYDENAKAYLRFHGDTAHTAEAGQQLSAVNVVIQKVQVTEGEIRDAAGNASPEITVVGSGEVFVLRGGRTHKGTWSRRNLSSKTTLVDGSGKAISLLPGNTWIELLPTARPVTLQ